MRPTERYPLRQSQRSVELGITFLGGLAIGGVLMYLLDPRTGTRRRVVLRDKTTSLAYRYARLSGKLVRHLRNKIEGLVSISTDFVRPTGIDSDAKIEARIRSVLGRTVPHPRVISVSVNQGRASLRGTLPPHEAGIAIRAIEDIRGVRGVENLLTAPIESGASPIQ
jgi:hypothetical protein